MKAARSIDITARTSAELLEQFDIKVTGTGVLFWEKSLQQQQQQQKAADADITLPKFLFRSEVLEDLERNSS